MGKDLKLRTLELCNLRKKKKDVVSQYHKVRPGRLRKQDVSDIHTGADNLRRPSLYPRFLNVSLCYLIEWC